MGGPAGRALVGTSGWYYRHWRGHLYPNDLPAGRYLERYAAVFSTVELNNSFYRLPTEAAFTGWRRATPAGFVFAVKASRYLTHIKRLLDPAEPFERLFDRARALGDKLGPILYQLPPRFAPDLTRLETFLAALPAGHRHVLEFRDPRWLEPAVLAALRQHGVGLCLHDWGGVPAPVKITAGFTYLRFHGPGKAYQGSYPDYELATWAERIAGWTAEGTDVYCYFNNDPGGHAVRNALNLSDLLERATGRSSAGCTP